MDSNVLFVISGPSGVGKGTLLADMVKADENLVYSVSATTRDMRPGEAEGVTYYYKTQEEFDRLVETGDVVEWDIYQGNKYGTLVSGLDRSLSTGKNIALDITVPGAVNINRIYGGRAVSVFILPPSVEELENRLIGRNREGEDEIRKRIAFAINVEMPQYKDFDYVIVNDREEEALTQLDCILRAGVLKFAEETGAVISEEEKRVIRRAEAFETSVHPDILEEKLNISKYAELYN